MWELAKSIVSLALVIVIVAVAAIGFGLALGFVWDCFAAAFESGQQIIGFDE